jgi:hypothetical protein
MATTSTKSQTNGPAKPTTRRSATAHEPQTKSPTKRFRVLLEKHESSEATGILIPFDVQKVFGTRARVPVRGTINGFAYRGSISPMGGGCHYMVVNKDVRAGAKAKGGEMISVVLERDTQPRTVEPPADFLRALNADRAARATWERLSYTHRKEHVRAVEEAKRPETRARRIEKSVSMLATGKKDYR